ncbi:MAG: hypothetical protein OXO52_17770 [Rhodospirillales bacterium]|nr:hypothetical protein [Rhodospirillales bacterium]MDE0379745.1 hypothetical protein [Rhodospirillales bacterium]
MSKYAALEAHLRESGQNTVPMTFADIERVIGSDLPPSAFKHRPWWSNNPSNSSITQSWLKAGYKTENVDMAGKKLVFAKAAQYSLPPGSEAPALRDEAPAPAVASGGFLSRVFGVLEGTVTIKPGTDLTAPIDTKWDATR